jgi:hypothetical protein
MSIESVQCLKIIDVFDHGVPNRERIAIFVKEPCDLSEFGLLIGLSGLDGSATPVKDHFLWFGHGFVNQGDWVIVFTASGSTTISKTVDSDGKPVDSDSKVISIHWGKEHTIFQNRSLVPMILQIGAVGVIDPPKPMLQGKPQINQPRLF